MLLLNSLYTLWNSGLKDNNSRWLFIISVSFLYAGPVCDLLADWDNAFEIVSSINGRKIFLSISFLSIISSAIDNKWLVKLHTKTADKWMYFLCSEEQYLTSLEIWLDKESSIDSVTLFFASINIGISLKFICLFDEKVCKGYRTPAFW